MKRRPTIIRRRRAGARVWFVWAYMAPASNTPSARRPGSPWKLPYARLAKARRTR